MAYNIFGVCLNEEFDLVEGEIYYNYVSKLRSYSKFEILTSMFGLIILPISPIYIIRKN